MIYALLGAATARSEAPWSFNVQVLRNTLLGSTRLQCIHSARRSSLRMDTDQQRRFCRACGSVS